MAKRKRGGGKKSNSKAVSIKLCPEDWSIVLSWSGFPWASVQCGAFSARNCFKKVSSLVSTREDFLLNIITKDHI